MINLDSEYIKIEEIINRETRAWDTKNANLLCSIFHPDMVWPWPPTANDHDPINWVIPLGKFNFLRWSKSWQTLFDNHELIHNKREIQKIVISNEGDGAFAVVDIDTLWRDDNGNEERWKGRVCKVYSKTDSEWKLTMHTGVLDYSNIKNK